jgi:peroxiredoxin
MLPMDGEFMVLSDGPKPLKVKDVFAGKKVVLFGLPGAMTPTCSEKQLPGFIANAAKFKAKGVDTIACLSVNDPFVMAAWQKAKDTDNAVLMLADGGAAFTKAAGLSFDTGNFGGVRCVRCAMVVDNGKVTALGLEEGGAFEGASSAENILEGL